MCVRVYNEGYEAHLFEDIEDRKDKREVDVEYDSCKTPMHATA